jgi:hypothetical protein
MLRMLDHQQVASIEDLCELCHISLAELARRTGVRCWELLSFSRGELALSAQARLLLVYTLCAAAKPEEPPQASRYFSDPVINKLFDEITEDLSKQRRERALKAFDILVAEAEEEQRSAVCETTLKRPIRRMTDENM